jgi:hypothetical protein
MVLPMIRQACRYWMAVVLVLLLHAGAAHAQNRLTGVVRDAEGNPVANAIVRVLNTATNAARTTTTSGDGSYTITGAATPSRRPPRSAAVHRAPTSSSLVMPPST